MKVSYRREMKHNYMIIDPEEITWREYECQMIENNAIEGLLRFQFGQSNGEAKFYYEITSRQPLSRLLESRTVSGEEIRRMVIGISNVLDQVERFLLNEGSILLEPDYVYVEPEAFRVWLCLVPGLNRDFPDAYGKLLEYILGKVNHQDKDSVVLAYGLYQETRKENYGMEDILRLIQQSTAPGSSWKDQGKEREAEGWPRQIAGRQELSGTASLEKTGGCQAKGAQKKDAGPDPAPVEEAEEKNVWLKVKAFFTGRGRKKKTGKQPDRLPWQSMFLDEEDGAGEGEAMLAAGLAAPALPQTAPLFRPKPSPPTSLPHTDFLPTGQDTILLSDASPGENTRRLRALDDGEPDIVISYYPFIIGKQENLADHILAHETVSRLHVRIDRMETEYRIMDLNSTNGTIVRGILLENNESAVLCPGDEVQIAKYRYRFE